MQVITIQLALLFGLACCNFAQPPPNIVDQGSGDGPSPYAPFTKGLPHVPPQQISSQNGVLDVTLEVDIGEMSLDWLTIRRRLYNGENPGPTIRLRPGDQVHLRLVNNLQDPDYTAPESRFLPLHQPNTTNMHLHGLHISPLEPQDNPFVVVGPGEEYHYYYEIDEDQPTGTFWYHPHHHGSVAFQTESGMAGMLIVDDNDDSEIANIEEVQIILQQFRYSEPGSFVSLQLAVQDDMSNRLDPALEGYLRNPANGISYMLVNGVLEPTIDMMAGVVKRFRMVNTAGLFLLGVELTIEDNNGNLCEFHEIAVDGVYLDEPRQPLNGRSFLMSGSRVDWLVRCPTPGTYQVSSTTTRADSKTNGFFPPFFNGPLWTIQVHGKGAVGGEMQTPELPVAHIYQDLRDVEEDEIAGRFAIELTPTSTLNREDYNGDYWRYKAEVDTVQEIIFTNTEFVMSHPMHMHVNKMQVISYNDYTGPIGVDDGDFYDGDWTLFSQEGEVCKYQHRYHNDSAEIAFPPNALMFAGHDNAELRNSVMGYNRVGDWLDVIQLPPQSNITVRFRTRRYTGPIAVHCHTTLHADKGMMLVFGIVLKGEDLTANVTHDGIYPWACNENVPNSLPKAKKEPVVERPTVVVPVVIGLSAALAFIACAVTLSRVGRGGV